MIAQLVRYLAYKRENRLEFQNPFKKKKKMMGMAMPSRGGRDGGIPEVPWPASLDDLVSSGSAKELVYKSNMHGAENEERFLFGLHTYAHMCMTPPP